MKRFLCLLLLVLVFSKPIEGFTYEVKFTDSSSNKIRLVNPPSRVVSLVPSITEMIVRLGADQSLIGVTHHDTWPAESNRKPVMGGFSNPDLEKIKALKPDVIFYSPIHKEIIKQFSDDVTLINLSINRIADSFEHLTLLGNIFSRQKEAAEIIAEQQRLIDLITKKTDSIPEEERIRTVRLMGRDRIMVPGDDSFQNEFIRKAGGIAPEFDQYGAIIEPALDQWQNFNPQVIYGCGDDRQVITKLSEPGWKDVDAVRNNRIIFFPCDLTCRASTSTGYFVTWLSSRLYGDHFSQPENIVLPSKVSKRKPVNLDYGYVEKAEKLYSDIMDFRNKTLVIKLKNPMTILSTLEGFKDEVIHVGNHYFPAPSWGLGHSEGLEGLRKRTFSALGLEGETSALLFTGANIDNLAVATEKYKDMKVTALVTAGVQGNALRMAIDTGSYYELAAVEPKMDKKGPGTINVILLSNTTLSNRAMTRALISAVEGKSAALQDMDIRSSATPGINPATGTGTDNVLIIKGSGPEIKNTGGHTKMGELIARAVYRGVTKAVANQNGITPKRSIFSRLKDRKTEAWQLTKQCDCGSDLGRGLERLLLEPKYASFVASAFAISDHYERGLVTDLHFFTQMCSDVARAIAGKKVDVKAVSDNDQPLVIRMALGAMISGLQNSQTKKYN